MVRRVAFLRAVNVGGRFVKMDALRALFESLGFSAVETFLASGNVVFESTSADEGPLAARIGRRLKAELGYEVAVFLRTDDELAAIARYEPFPAADLARAAALNIAFLAAPLDGPAQARLAPLRTPIDDFHVHGREVYWLCRRKQSESTFSNAALERALGIQATLRGVNTVRKLAAKLRPAD